MYFLHAINSDRQTRMLNVLEQIAMILGDKIKVIIDARCKHEDSLPKLKVQTFSEKMSQITPPAISSFDSI